MLIAHALPTRQKLAGHAQRGLRLGMSLGDQALVSSTNFATTVLLGRELSKTEFGVFGMAFAGLLFATEALHAVITTPHQVLLAQQPSDRRRVFNGSSLLHTSGLGSLLAVGCLVAWIVTGKLLFVGLALATLALLARHFTRIFLFTTGKSTFALPLDATVALLQIGGLGWLWQTDQLVPWTALLVLGGANLLAAVGMLLVRRGDFQINLRQTLGDLSTTWRLSRWIFLSGLIWTLGTHGYPWLIGGISGAAAVGPWTACFAIGAIANPMLMGVQNLIGPAVAEVAARPDSDELRRFVTKSTWLFVLLMTPYATAAFFGGEWFLKLYDGQYDGFGMVVSILALASLTHAFGFASSRALFARGGARHDVIANSLALVMMLGPGSIAIYTNGIRGAAGVMLASLAVSNLYRVIAFLRMTKGAT